MKSNIRIVIAVFFASALFDGETHAQDILCDGIVVDPKQEIIEIDELGYWHVTAEGMFSIAEAGAPDLPCLKRTYYIPSDVGDCKLIESVSETTVLKNNFLPFPSQGMSKAELDENRTIIPLDKKYTKGRYPAHGAEIIGKENVMGCQLLTIAFYPYYYDADNKQLCARSVSVNIECTRSAHESRPLPSSPFRRQSIEALISSIVCNPQDVDIFDNHDEQAEYALSVSDNAADFPYIPDYVIVTTEELKPYFRQFAEWKTCCGIPTVIETTEHISEMYSGIDLCEKIHNYIT